MICFCYELIENNGAFNGSTLIKIWLPYMIQARRMHIQTVKEEK